MTSLYSTTVSPVKDGLSSPLFRPSNTGKPPLRALYDLLIAPMEGVCMCVPQGKTYISIHDLNLSSLWFFTQICVLRLPSTSLYTGPDAQ